MSRASGIAALSAVLVAGAILALVMTTDVPLLDIPKDALQDLVLSFDNPANPNDSSRRSFTVEAGESAARISQRLENAGLVRNATQFRILAEVEGVATDLAAGNYELAASMRPSEILTVLVHAKTKLGPLLTIPEGWRAEEIAARLTARGVAQTDSFMGIVQRGESDLAALGSRPQSAGLEGYLFPDSYAIDSKTTGASIASRMVTVFDDKFTVEMRQQATALGMTVHQIVTLASIIEREAVLPAERPLMAGVFYNRLDEGMPLQSDPTVQYALSTSDADSQRRYGWWKTALTSEDLLIDSPYNSYRYSGLPPGPISNPGLASLLAALNPEKTDFIYFVARPDGSHVFSKTLEEHNDNVAEYAR